MTDAPTKPAQPISVKAHAAPIIGEEGFHTLVIAVCAVAAAHLVQSQLALAAVLPAGAVVAAVGWRLVKRLETWRALTFLTRYVGDDDVAVVGDPK